MRDACAHQHVVVVRETQPLGIKSGDPNVDVCGCNLRAGAGRSATSLSVLAGSNYSTWKADTSDRNADAWACSQWRSTPPGTRGICPKKRVEYCLLVTTSTTETTRSTKTEKSSTVLASPTCAQ